MSADSLKLALRCALCGESLDGVTVQQPACPACNGQPRTRTLPQVLHDYVGPRLEDVPGHILLAFAMPTIEERVIKPIFHKIVSVSLYGKYRSDHIEGVDARNLSRFDSRSFEGVFGCLLFDYFEESEIALGECYRVLKPGGVFFTHIAPNRLLPGFEPPRVRGVVTKRTNGFGYVPEGSQFSSIEVSADWFLGAMKRAGFDTSHVTLADEATGIVHDWFVGQKRRFDVVASKPPQSPTIIRLGKIDICPSNVDEVRPEVRSVMRRRFDLPASTGVRHLEVELSTLSFEDPLKDIGFAEHNVGRNGSELVCVANNVVLVSCDEGMTFRRFTYSGSSEREFWNTFSPVGYDHRLLQLRGWAAEADKREESEAGRLYIMQSNGRLTASGQCSSAQWHGSYSIDQVGDTIIFGDYNVNTAQFRTKPRAQADEDSLKFIRDSTLFRSSDAGLTWSPVLQLSPDIVRHFHTVVADSVLSRVWWASTGDFPAECRIFRSADDGLTWTEVSSAFPKVPLPPGDPSRLRSCFRHTAIVQTAEDIRWGADDIYGAVSRFDDSLPVAERAGARLYVASRNLPLSPREVGYCGHPVRSIVDGGPGYFIFTEAYYKKVDGTMLPEVKFWSKLDPEVVVDLFKLDNFRGMPTGFTYSRSSKIARGGTFFTYRGPDIGLKGRERMLRWDVRFD